MKTDITSGPGILSRKIKWALGPFFILLILLSQAVAAPVNQGYFDPLMTASRLMSVPKNELVVVDTRSKLKYLFGHIPGAVNLSSWEEFTRKKNGSPGFLIDDLKLIAQKLRSAGIDHSKTIVVYGNPEDKWRSDGRFFWMFERFGFQKTALLDGGLDAWTGKGGELERGRGDAPRPSNLKASDIRLNENVIADKSWIKSRLGSPNIKLIDNREKHEYEGATPYGSKRGGHIPGAVHIDWRRFFSDDGFLKNREQVKALLASYGINRDDEAVMYCTGGVRSAMAYFVFRHLKMKTRNYDGSWWDWSADLVLPVES